MTDAVLPADDHVHSEWSWDARFGSMEQSCASAVALGLPAISFTEHFDHTRWVLPAQAQATMTEFRHLVGDDGRFNPPPFDVAGYQRELQRCRDLYPDLRIISGVELGEPHWFPAEVGALLAGDDFDRVLGSLHSIEVGGGRWIVDDLDEATSPPGLEPLEVARLYLAQALRMVEGCDRFTVLAHIDYPARAWGGARGSFPVLDLEEEFRAVLTALASSGRALEVNTRLPLSAYIVEWWSDVGGSAVTFGSDAHNPAEVGAGFRAVADMVAAKGFRPSTAPYEPWIR